MKVPASSGTEFYGVRSVCCSAEVHRQFVREGIDLSLMWDAEPEPMETVCSRCHMVNPAITFSEELRQEDEAKVEHEIQQAEQEEWHKTLDRNPQRL